MSCMKRLLRGLMVLALVATAVFIPNTMRGDIVFSGDCSPDYPIPGWDSFSEGYVGMDAPGALTITNGTESYLACWMCYIGYTAEAYPDPVFGQGSVTVDGDGAVLDSEVLYVGYGGEGTLSIQNGGAVNSWFGILGDSQGASGTVTVAGPGSTWTNGGSLKIGKASPSGGGYGIMEIQSGGTVSNTEGTIDLGSEVTVDGSGATWNNNGRLYVGKTGWGTLTIKNGGAVMVADSTHVAYEYNANGEIDFGTGGGTLTTKSLYAAPSQLSGTGTIETNGLVSDVNLTFDSASSLNQTVTGAGSFGSIAVTLDLSDSNNVGDLGAGYKGTTGALMICNGVTVHSQTGYLGYAEVRSPDYLSNSSGTATVTGAGSTWNCQELYVGTGGTGTLNITAGGSVVNTTGHIGENPNSGSTVATAGTVTVDGPSTWTNTQDLIIGKNYSKAVLKITNGGSVSVGDTTYVGQCVSGTSSSVVLGGGTLSTKQLYASSTDLMGTGSISSKGIVGDFASLTFSSSGTLSSTINDNVTLTLDMSSTADAQDLGVGYRTTGSSLTISGGAVCSHNGFLAYDENSSGTATVTGAGSMWNNNSDLCIGYGGSGTLNIQNGGAVTVAGTTYLATATGWSSPSGTIAFGGTGGTLSTKGLDISMPSQSQITGTGTINARGIVGNVSLEFDGSGQTSAMLGALNTVTLNLDMSDSTNVDDLGVGCAGSGSLMIKNGAAVYAVNGYVGYGSSGTAATATVTGGATWSCSGTIHVGSIDWPDGSDGILNITDGGTVIVNSIQGVDPIMAAGSMIVNFDGGVLKANGASNPAWISGTGDVNNVFIMEGGATFDTGANDMGICAYLQHGGTAAIDGGLTKLGDGTLTLVGSGGDIDPPPPPPMSAMSNLVAVGAGPETNTFTGATNVNAGILAYGYDDALYTGDVNINGGTLSLGIYSDTVGAVTLISGAIVGGTTGGDDPPPPPPPPGLLPVGSIEDQIGTLASTSGFEVRSGEISVRLAGDVGVTKTGDGLVILSGFGDNPNTYTGATTVASGTLVLVGADAVTPIAWDPVLNGAGADIQGGKLVFNYTGTSPADTIATILDDSFGATNPFSQGNSAQIYSTTADAAGMALGWIDNGFDEVTVMYTLYGDSNLDGSVNGTDLNAVLSNYNQSSEIWEHGDFNYDGSVNGTDLNSVLSNYNQSLSSATATVPEPSTLLLMVLGLAGLMAWRKRK